MFRHKYRGLGIVGVYRQQATNSETCYKPDPRTMSMSLLECCGSIGIGRRKNGQRRLHEVRAELRNYLSTVATMHQEFEKNRAVGFKKSQMTEEIKKPTIHSRETNGQTYSDENNNRIGSPDQVESIFVDIPLDDEDDDDTSKSIKMKSTDIADRNKITNGKTKKRSLMQRLFNRHRDETTDGLDNEAQRKGSNGRSGKGQYERIIDTTQRDSKRSAFRLFRSRKHN